MNRRTLDIVFSVGGLLVAALILVLGLVLQNQANFAEDYVHDQLTAQQIVFTPEDKLTEEEKANTCLVVYAGEQLVTGKQAECYANDYIGLHLGETNDGKTYSQTSTESRAAATAAKADPEQRRAGRNGQGARRQGPDPLPGRDPARPAADLVRLQHLR